VTGYQVRIWRSSPVVRTVTVPLAADVSAQAAFVYTAAMQVEDFGSVQTVVT
jgi:hypothetical protein